MLVVTRKPGQSITIEGVGTIQFVRHNYSRDESIRLGLEIDKSIRVLRTELLDVDRQGDGETGSLPVEGEAA